MNFNVMNLLFAKTVAEQQGLSSQRAFEIGLVSSMMPGWQGLLLAVMAARNEAPPPPPKKDDVGLGTSRSLPGSPTAK